MYGLRGHHLPVRARGAPLARGRVALAGDAAGLIDPLSGEGIFAAMYSGGAAARAACGCLPARSRSLTPYAEQIERVLMPDLEASRRFQDVFYLVPGVYVGLLERSDRIWRLLARLIRGEQTYVGLQARLGALGFAVDGLSLLCAHTARPRRRPAAAVERCGQGACSAGSVVNNPPANAGRHGAHARDRPRSAARPGAGAERDRLARPAARPAAVRMPVGNR